MAINGEQLLLAVEEIEASKGISKEVILAALKEAMIKGYKKFIGATEEDDNVRVEINPDTGVIDMYYFKTVVKEVETDDFLEISVEDANKLDPSKKYKVGDEFIIRSNPDELTKAVAMSIKSIVKQKFAEAEKNVLYEAFKDKIGTMITGRVEKVDDRGLSVNIGRTSVYLPRNQMIGDERYLVGEQIKLFVNNVISDSKGARINVTRSNEGFLKCLFQEEIHEIYDGTIEIKGIAREAGERSKVAVYTSDPNVDPAGSCIGPNGSRIQKIVGQLGNGNAKEKIDIIGYSEVTGLYIMESLKPAKVVGIILNEEEKSATAIVKDDSLSLAIGKKGVNVRLAVKLTGFNIDIKTETVAYEEGLEYTSYEELQNLDYELKSKAAYEKLAAQYRNEGEQTSVLPGLPEGYVAPQQRVYAQENNAELEEALEQVSEKEELVSEIKEAPKAEEKVEEAPVIEEAPVVEEEKKEVKTTTSLEDLEKSLSEESNKQSSKGGRRNTKKKKDESEEESSKGALDTSSAERMSIYTEEELREMEKEDESEEEEFEDDVDYDEYDDYYDDDDR